ncbi:MAG: zf-HC2 domain-containing protein [Planctomycetales bacterium]|nr:zf-HC2 domain-containing protein [Planctomycetales bacterium]
MTACALYRDHLSGYAEGDLRGARRDLLAAHLARCPGCGWEMARLARALDVLAVERGAREEPALDLAPIVLARLGLPAPRRSSRLAARAARLPRALRYAAAAALLLAAAAGSPSGEPLGAGPLPPPASARDATLAGAPLDAAPGGPEAARRLAEEWPEVVAEVPAVRERVLSGALSSPTRPAVAEAVIELPPPVEIPVPARTEASVESAGGESAGAAAAAGSVGARLPPSPGPPEILVSVPPSATTALATLCEGLRVLPGVPAGDAVLVPLARPGPVAVRGPVAPLGPALAAGAALVRETDRGVRVENRSDRALLLVAGEVVTGGNQDRLVARDLVVEPGGVAIAEVFCCEEGRSTPHAPGETAFRRLPALALPRIRSLLLHGRAQDEVWACIADHQTRARVTAPTRALQTTYLSAEARSRAGDAGSRLAAAGAAANLSVAGYACVRGGTVEVLDLFAGGDFGRLAAQDWVAGAVVETGAGGGAGAGDPDPEAARRAVASALKSALSGATEDRGGRELLLRGRDGALLGAATLRAGEAVHLCLASPPAAAPAPGAAPGGTSRRVDPTPPAGPVPVPSAGTDPSYGELERKAERDGRLTDEQQRLQDRRADRRRSR